MRKFFLIFFLLIIPYFILYKIYVPRISAFGCFDDCFSFAAGYFINHNKVLYSEIFYNHQMLPAYISSALQSASHPVNIFDLVLKHRQFVLLFGIVFNFFLVFRFGIPAFLFFLFFEFSKFYIFGDRFLAEGILIYPLVYLIFVSWQKLQKIKINNYDFVLSAISAWLIIFLRETFIPLAVLLFLFILFPYKKFSKFKILSVSLFLVLTIGLLLTVNFKDYYFSLFEVNKVFFIQDSSNFLKVLFYPLYILTSSKWNLFRVVLAGIDLLFLFSITYLLIKKRTKILFAFIPLIFANLRVVEPGRLFYDSFHMIPFYGIFLSLTFLISNEIKKYNKRVQFVLIILALVLFLYYLTSPQIFFRDKINPHEEFITNYGNILQVGEVIRKLSSPKDTFFVDGFDEAVYWVANRPSSYRYSMYTSFMPNFPMYSNARIKMFEKNPPDFYYGSCAKEKNANRLMPEQFITLYIRLNAFGQPSCVFVKKEKIKDITQAQWKNAKEFGYELP